MGFFYCKMQSINSRFIYITNVNFPLRRSVYSTGSICSFVNFKLINNFDEKQNETNAHDYDMLIRKFKRDLDTIEFEHVCVYAHAVVVKSCILLCFALFCAGKTKYTSSFQRARAKITQRPFYM